MKKMVRWREIKSIRCGEGEREREADRERGRKRERG
jgi:hypothetical protein